MGYFGIPHPHIGHIQTEETRKKISFARTGKKYPKLSLAKIGKPGKKHTEEWKRLASERLKNNPQGFIKDRRFCKYWLGKKNPHITGEKNPQWKGGISKENVILRNKPEYRKWRREILIRDRWTCQYCGQKNIKIEVHHIKSWKEYPDLRLDKNNGITLCINCHHKTRSK